MQTRLKDWTLELPDGGFILCAYAPTGPVLCAARNALMTVNPDAFALTPDQSEAIRRQAETARVPRASVPPFVDVEREDDTGEPYVIPGCATGTCDL